MTTEPLSAESFETALRAAAAERCQRRHPFHQLLREGCLNKGQLQAWALNRYVHLEAIPRRDAVLFSRIHDREVRRAWLQRIIERDGFGEDHAGTERWLVITDRLGLDRDYVVSMAGALPAVRFAAEAYVSYVAEHGEVAAVASSLVDLSVSGARAPCVAAMLANYDLIDDAALTYLGRGIDRTAADTRWALAYVKERARTRAQQDAAIAALRFKADVLWAQLDGLYAAYVAPRLIPPGAFCPAGSYFTALEVAAE